MEELKQLGLTDNEIKVYRCLLDFGSITIGEISRLSNVKRTTVYSCVDKLKKIGLILEGSNKKKKLYWVNKPEKLLEEIEKDKENFRQFIEKKERTIKNLIPQLKNNSNQENKIPTIRYFEGLSGIWDIVDDYIKSKQDIYIIYNGHILQKLINSDIVQKKFTERRRRVRTKAYYITNLHENTIKDHFLGELDLSEYRFLPHDVNPDSFIGFYGNKIVILNTKKPIWGLLVESKEITQTIKILWNISWNNLKGKNIPSNPL